MIKHCWWRHIKSLSLVFLRTLLTQPNLALGAHYKLPSNMNSEECRAPPGLTKPWSSGPVWPYLWGGAVAWKSLWGHQCMQNHLLCAELLEQTSKIESKESIPIFHSLVVFWNGLFLICSRCPNPKTDFHDVLLPEPLIEDSHLLWFPAWGENPQEQKQSKTKSHMLGAICRPGLSFLHRPICLQDWILSDHFHGNSCGIRIGWRFRKSCWNSVTDQWGLFNYTLALPWKRKFTNQAGFW